jgi:methionyl-tRNA formyltransferase
MRERIRAMRVVFMGTPEFSIPCLKALLNSDDVHVVGVVTQPDRPSGRGKKLQPPPVKVLAEAHGIPLIQPTRLRKEEESMAWMEALAPDFVVTIAFGQILPTRVLNIPKHGVVNVHASLLPEYRGANPIQWAVLNGNTCTGLTTMFSDEGVDTGDMLAKWETLIEPHETTGQLAERMSEAAGSLLLETLKGIESGNVKPQKQDDALATLAPKLGKQDALVHWDTPAIQVVNRIRGLNPWPGAVAYLQGGSRVKLGLATMCGTLPEETEQFIKNATPGQIVAILKEGLLIQTKDGAIVLQHIQPDGKGMMNATDWARNVVKPFLDEGTPFIFQQPAIAHAD